MTYQYKFIIVFILILISAINNIYFYKNNNKTIFTFWEPKDNIPGFLRLCIKTWKKFLPDYNIIILDYKTSEKYIGEPLFSKIICKNMSLMVQSDAIRVAMLLNTVEYG